MTIPSLPGALETLQRVSLLISQGRLQEAEASLRRLRAETAMFASQRNLTRSEPPVRIRAEVAARLGVLLAGQNRTSEAIDYLREAVELGAPRQIQVLFSKYLSASQFTKPDAGLKALLVRAYREHWYLPADLARTAASALAVEPAFIAARQKLGTRMLEDTLSDGDVRKVISEPLLLALLNAAIIPDEGIEQLLTDIRRTLLRAALHSATDLAWVPMPFCAALANQCFANEYAFAETDEERSDVAALVTRLSGHFHAAAVQRDLCLVAAYRPLCELSCARQVLEAHWDACVKQTIVRQIEEPFREKELESTVPKLTSITAPLSVLVQKQYEENPYPRWEEIPSLGKRRSLGEWLAGNLPGVSLGEVPDRPFKLLVAGCGTGMEIVSFNVLLKNVSIDAFDLSVRSLAYAARKISELGLTNVRLGQADLLELEQWPERYQAVSASGVLHHLENPIHGWRILANLVDPGGYMLIALYSEAGRRDLAALSRFARQGVYGTSPKELRRFRADILALPSEDPLRRYATARDDFYNLSMLRDMVFHVSERTFTIAKIGAALKDLELVFRGFMVEPEVRALFGQRFGDRSACSLSAWEEFERDNPGTFSQMYHLVVQKPH